MIKLLSEDQSEYVTKLGEWRDAGHPLAVGLDGRVFIHPADQGDYHVAIEEREGAARRQGPATPPGVGAPSGIAPPFGAAAPSESPRENGIANLKDRYLAAMPEVREFYPDLRVIEVEDGIWVVTQIFPIGRDGPFFTICLFLSDCKAYDPKAFAFRAAGHDARSVGLRHTNIPDASICAYSADDGVWQPGASPLVLLNLYAEWLICQLYLAAKGYWPGRQIGLSASYRYSEFRDQEWCDCGSDRRYGECHRPRDAEAVKYLKTIEKYTPIPDRKIPVPILTFARSGWTTPPATTSLHLYAFRDRDSARTQLLQQRLVEAAGPQGLLDIGCSAGRSISLRTRLLNGASTRFR